MNKFLSPTLDAGTLVISPGRQRVCIDSPELGVTMLLTLEQVSRLRAALDDAGVAAGLYDEATAARSEYAGLTDRETVRAE